MTEDELAWARAYVLSVSWRQASTVAVSEAHAYLMRQHADDLEAYEQMVALIRRYGVLRLWRVPGTDRVIKYKYLSLDNHEYWCTTRPGLWSLNRRVHVEPEGPLLPV